MDGHKILWKCDMEQTEILTKDINPINSVYVRLCQYFNHDGY